jgi:hypothetical protein
MHYHQIDETTGLQGYVTQTNPPLGYMDADGVWTPVANSEGICLSVEDEDLLDKQSNL